MPQQVAPGLLSWASDIEPGTIEQAARAARLLFVRRHMDQIVTLIGGLTGYVNQVSAGEPFVTH
jgi:hypothetical protein